MAEEMLGNYLLRAQFKYRFKHLIQNRNLEELTAKIKEFEKFEASNEVAEVVQGIKLYVIIEELSKKLLEEVI